MDGTSTIRLILCSYFMLISTISIAADSINTTQSISDGKTIVSAGEVFRLGFFSPGNSKNRYLGIWYNKVTVLTVVWVANRIIPIPDSSGILRISDEGSLVLVNHNKTIIWSSNSTRTAKNPVAQLLDSGNFIVKDDGDENPENYLWQSFDHPSDTFMPEMKLGWNRVTGLGRYISSWRTPDDPAPGNFTYVIYPGGYPEPTIREGSTVRFRSGPWNGIRFSGSPALTRTNPVYAYDFVLNEKEWYYYFRLRSSIISKLIINPNGKLQRFIWSEGAQAWTIYLTVPIDDCDQYALCGAYGTCNINNSPVCSCLRGFEPKNPKDWEMVEWSSGCVRTTPLNCPEDGFQKFSDVKLPETRNSWFNRSTNLEDCRIMCLKNCSCTAYTNLDITNGGSGCLLWYSGLIDSREVNENGQDIYIRMAASEIVNDMKNARKSNAKKITVSTVLSAGMFFLGLSFLLYVRRKKLQKYRKKTSILEMNRNDNGKKGELELPLFDFATISCATNNFSTANKLGEGGFGPVFMGTFGDGQEIAVKRLSTKSKQGHDEFKNEVMHIAKLQHRNLVKLLGCCIESEEKMIIYEFMPNKSLDFFIFDEARRALIDWPKRYQIINGIARGLLYLHQDSRLRIIHRDLKVGNILLDYEMNPKISDFGLARSFGGNESEANTNKVVGTYGYMSPEYAIYGLYSVKSDVYSFGVIVLEIISGKRNRGFFCQDHLLNLLTDAWRLHKEGRSIEMIDPSLQNSCIVSEVLRSVHIGLLCVQRSLEDRPSMSAVVVMLSCEGALPEPKQPGFFTEKELSELNSSSSYQNSLSANGLSITQIYAR